MKPLMVARKEFAQQLTELIANSGCPLCVLEPLVANAYQMILKGMQEQEKREYEEYNRQLAMQNED